MSCKAQWSIYTHAVRQIDSKIYRLSSERITHVLMNNSGHKVRRINSKPTSVPPSLDDATSDTSIADH